MDTHSSLTTQQTAAHAYEAMPASPNEQALLHITYYTDPLCSWSWAFEPQWRRLRYEFGAQIEWRYCMGGMIADWQHYSDPLNDISRPVQMGPQWYQVHTLSGMPFDERIWYDDPPTSSYPAGVAVKATEQQGAAAADRYLRRLREAAMVERCNIARQEVLLAIAAELAEQGMLDAEQFQQDLANLATIDAFREDLKEVRWREIGRFPTLILRNNGPNRNPKGAIMLVGYRPYPALRNAVMHISPALEQQRTADDLLAYIAYWNYLTTREAAELTNGDLAAAEQILQAAAAAGKLHCRELLHARQAFWHAGNAGIGHAGKQDSV